MAQIKIQRGHGLGRDEAHRRVSDIEPMLKDRYGVELAWRGDEAKVRGTGVRGTLLVGDTKVTVDLELGLLLGPVAGKIREALERRIDQALA